MAVHVPLSFEAQLEARVLMLSSNNVLKPADGRPVAEPSQDIVLGCYFATKAPAGFDALSKDMAAADKLQRFTTPSEVEVALMHRRINTQTPIRFLVTDAEGRREWIVTTPGRVQFNQIVPAVLGFQNRELKKKVLSELAFDIYRSAGLKETTTFLDNLKDFGFAQATRYRRPPHSAREGRAVGRGLHSRGALPARVRHG
jgi:DNA-directed RNA polymerase subunit beta'